MVDWVVAAMTGSDSVRTSLLAAMADFAYTSTTMHTPVWFDQIAARVDETLRT